MAISKIGSDGIQQDSNTVLCASSGNVGIGTSSPAKKLHVYTTVDTPAQFESSGTASYIRFANSGASNGYVGYNSSSAMEFLTAGSERMRIDSSGNVGIGTSSPAAKLDVTRSGNGNTQYWNNGTISTYLYQGSGITSFGTATNHNLVFVTNDTTRMTLDTSGNLQFNSGYGSAATAYGCRAWVNFNGTGTVAIRASGNVSSITDNGTGAYVVNMTNAMPNTNYAPISCGNNTAGSAAQNSMYNSTPVTTSTFTVNIVTNGGGPRDDAVVTSAVFR